MDQSAPRLYTIGYGNRSFHQLVELLYTHGVYHLVDVRSHPVSRQRPEFSKSKLAGLLDAADIRYHFMGQQLGGRPRDPAYYTGQQVDYDKLQTADFYREGIEALHEALAFRQGLAILCAELRPEHCHRARLIGETLVAEGVEVLHIDADGAAVPHAEVMDRLAGGQLALFGDE